MIRFVLRRPALLRSFSWASFHASSRAPKDRTVPYGTDPHFPQAFQAVPAWLLSVSRYATRRQQPIDPTPIPEEPYYLPLTVHRSPFTAHRSPLTAHRLLRTAYCSPLTAHRLLLTAYCSPLTAHRLPFHEPGALNNPQLNGEYISLFGPLSGSNLLDHRDRVKGWRTSIGCKIKNLLKIYQ